MIRKKLNNVAWGLEFGVSTLRLLVPKRMIKKKQNNVVWGLEFGGSALRLVRVRRNGSDYQADKFLEVALDDRWEKPADVTAALAEMSSQKLSEALVICGADERVLFRTLRLPEASAGALAKMIQNQLEVLIPTQSEHFASGYSNYPDPSEPGRQRVVLCAVRREVLRGMLESSRQLGREPAGAIPSILALSVCWPQLSQDSQTPLVLLDVGARCTGIALLDGGRVAHCGLIDQGGDHWSERIAEELGIGYAEAEKRKLSYAASRSSAQDDPQVHDCLGPVLDDWSRRLREAYRNCLENTSPNRRAGRCIVFGRSARMPGLSELISGTLGLQIAQPDIPKRLTLAEGLDFSRSAPAIGAAFCGMQENWPSLNLAATSKESVQGRKVFSWKWAALLAWLIAAVISLYVLDIVKAARLSNTNAEAHKKTAKQGGLDQQLAIAKYLERSGPTPLEVLDRISEVLPEKTLLTSWTYSRNGEVTIGGTVPKEKDFWPMLRKLSQLGQADLKRARPDKKKFRFEIALAVGRSSPTPVPASPAEAKEDKPEEPSEKAPEAAEKTPTKEEPAKEADSKEAPSKEAHSQETDSKATEPATSEADAADEPEPPKPERKTKGKGARP